MQDKSEYKYTSDASDAKNKPVLYINKQIIKFPGQYIRVFDAHHRLIAKVHSLPLKLKEKLNIYSDEERTNLIATSAAIKIIDFNASFVVRSSEGEALGGLRRKGLQSELGNVR